MSDDEDWWTQVQEARKRARELEAEQAQVEGQLSLAPPSFDEMIPQADEEDE